MSFVRNDKDADIEVDEIISNINPKFLNDLAQILNRQFEQVVSLGILDGVEIKIDWSGYQSDPIAWVNTLSLFEKAMLARGWICKTSTVNSTGRGSGAEMTLSQTWIEIRGLFGFLLKTMTELFTPTIPILKSMSKLKLKTEMGRSIADILNTTIPSVGLFQKPIVSSVGVL